MSKQAYFQRAIKNEPAWATTICYSRKYARFEYHEKEVIENTEGSEDWVSLGKIEYLPAWEEIKKEHYFEMLEILPPEKWKQGLGKNKNIGIFRMCEYYTGTLTMHYICLRTEEGKYRYFSKMENTQIDYSLIVKEIESQLLIKKLAKNWQRLRKIANGREDLECTYAARRVLIKRKARVEEIHQTKLPESLIDYSKETSFDSLEEQRKTIFN